MIDDRHEGSPNSNNICYKTSDVLALYGMSNKGLFFYEDKGLIAPERTPGNQYRIYTLKETARLHRCRIYREFGFSVDESIALVQKALPGNLRECLGTRKKSLARQAMWLDFLQKEIDDINDMIARIEAKDIPYEVYKSKKMYRKPLRNIGEEYTDETSIIYQKWQEYLPLATASLSIDCESIKGQIERPQVNLGFIIDADCLDMIGGDILNDSEVLEPAVCLFTIISGSDYQLDEYERIRPPLDWIKRHNYRLAGNPFTRMIATFDNGDGMRRYDKAWFPIVVNPEF